MFGMCLEHFQSQNYSYYTASSFVLDLLQYHQIHNIFSMTETRDFGMTSFY